MRKARSMRSFFFTPGTADGGDGLPSVRAMLWFPSLVFLLALILSIFGISGSSTGMWWQLSHSSADPSLLIGTPRAITSDLWYVQDSWIASQIAQGFPALNHSFPGGMDATFMNDLPSWDWSTAFRPHLWGYLIGSSAIGNAWRWWSLGAFAVSGIYLAAVTLLPKHPLLSSGIAIFTIASPLVQWWYRPQSLLPLGWSFLVIAAAVYALRGGIRRPSSRVLTILAGYFAVPTALTIYVPFIVPCALVSLFLVIGLLIESAQQIGFAKSLQRLIPLACAALGAGIILAAWAFQHRAAIQATSATVYPGARDTDTGACALALGECAQNFAALWDRALQYAQIAELGPNQVEASGAISLGLYLFPVLLLLLFLSIRHRRVDWAVVAMIATLVLFLAYLYIPGWDSLASIFALNRTFSTRLRIGFLAVSAASLILIVRGYDYRLPSMSSRIASVGGILTAVLVVQLGVFFALWDDSKILSSVSRTTFVLAVVLVVSCALIGLGYFNVGLIGLVAVSMALSAGINPLYRGWTNLASTPIGIAISTADEQDSGGWIGITTADGIGTMAPTGFLLAAGVETYNGVQTYPSSEMWSRIDPSGTYSTQWNRLAAITWQSGSGEPVVENPAQDQIRVTFDSCSQFAQENIRHVFATAPIDQSCLVLASTAQWGDLTGYIYDVADNR